MEWRVFLQKHWLNNNRSSWVLHKTQPRQTLEKLWNLSRKIELKIDAPDFSLGVVHSIQNYGKPIQEERVKQIATILSFSSEVDADFLPDCVYNAIHQIRERKKSVSLRDKMDYDIKEGLSLNQLRRDEQDASLIIPQ